jgi:MGT family glycosyltransferase
MTSIRDRRSVAVFCMPWGGHLQRLRPVIAGLSARGIAVNVFTDSEFAPAVVRAGGIFHDLFGQFPIAAADNATIPVPCRYVAHAAKFGESIARAVAQTRPSLVVHDVFAIVARVVANRLGIPRVSVCSGHNVAPQRFTTIMQQSPHVRLAPECLRAVEELRDSWGIADASPFSYISTLSPLLNLYGEPPEFLHEDERHPFEPLAFFGSLQAPDGVEQGAAAASGAKGARPHAELSVFVSFGTVVWKANGGAYAADSMRALTTLTMACAQMDNVRAIVSLGRASVGAAELAALAHPNVSVEPYVDQWRVLQESDVFITHHGLNSTHESIFHRVPMISYPFFWDQPALATRCQAFGLAVPLVAGLRGPIAEADVNAALDRIATGKEAMISALDRARGWELAVMANRPAVLQQMVDLML